MNNYLPHEVPVTYGGVDYTFEKFDGCYCDFVHEVYGTDSFASTRTVITFICTEDMTDAHSPFMSHTTYINDELFTEFSLPLSEAITRHFFTVTRVNPNEHSRTTEQPV